MTKRILSVIIALLLAMTVFVACDEEPAVETQAPETDAPETEAPAEPVAASAVELLVNAYDAFAEALAPSFGMPAEDIKMSFMGGYFDENDPAAITQGPGSIPVDNEAISYEALLPTDAVAKVDDAAILKHPMMLNFFVGVAFRVTNEADIDSVVDGLKNSIANNHWQCGQPEGYYVIKIDNFVVSTYGLMDNINALKDAITSTYEDAVVVYEGSFIG